MFHPKVPTNPTPTGLVVPLTVEPTAPVRHAPAPAPVAQSSTRPAPPYTSRPVPRSPSSAAARPWS